MPARRSRARREHLGRGSGKRAHHRAAELAVLALVEKVGLANGDAALVGSTLARPGPLREPVGLLVPQDVAHQVLEDVLSCGARLIRTAQVTLSDAGPQLGREQPE